MWGTYSTLTFFLLVASVYTQSPGDPCHPITTPCTDINSICRNDGTGNFFCTCVQGFFLHSGICTRLPLLPGHSCDITLAPCDSISNTICDNSICTCNPNYSHDTVNHRCIATPEYPGDICQRLSVPCSFGMPPLTECGPVRPELGESICTCFAPNVTDIANKNCLIPPTNPGDTCTPALTPCTTVVNTTCAQDGVGDWICNCNEDLILQPVTQECLIPPKLPGDKCDLLYSTCGKVANTNCIMNTTNSATVCICDYPYVTDFYEGKCLTLPTLPGDPCHLEHTPCDGVANTTCGSDDVDGSNTYCKCDKGYVNIPEEQSCLALPLSPGNPCHFVLAPCHSVNNTICTSNQCQCVGDLVTDVEYGRCLRPPELAGSSCHPTLAPCHPVPRTECSYDETEGEFLCKCQLGFIFNPANNTCLTVPTLPGDHCDINLPLPCSAVINATTCHCNPGPTCYCKCDGELVNDPDHGRCLSQPVYPNDTCHRLVADCTAVPNTICDQSPGSTDFTCVCVNGYIYDLAGKRCIQPPVLPGDPCEPDLATCSYIDNTTCVWDPPFGNRCRCLGNLITEDGSCFPIPTHPSDRCSLTLSPCTSVTNTTCIRDGTFIYPWCRCGSGFFTDFAQKICVPLPDKPGQPCIPGSSHCDDILNTECVLDPINDSYTCQCIPNYFQPGNGACLPLPTKPLDPCDLDPHCSEVEGTQCTRDPPQAPIGSCTCIPADWDLSDDNSECIRKAELLNQSCAGNSSCSKISLSYCPLGDPEQRICSCIEDHVPSATLRHCLAPVTRIGDTCSEDIQCQAGVSGDSDCLNSTCVCRNGYIPTPGGDNCILDPNPNKQCLNSEECLPILGPYSYCDLTIYECTCFDNSTIIGSQCRYPVFLGDECELTEECTLGSGNLTYCDPISNTCMCVSGYAPVGDVCLRRGGIGRDCMYHEDCFAVIEGPSMCHNETGRCICIFDHTPVTEFVCAMGLVTRLNLILLIGALILHYF